MLSGITVFLTRYAIKNFTFPKSLLRPITIETLPSFLFSSPQSKPTQNLSTLVRMLRHIDPSSIYIINQILYIFLTVKGKRINYVKNGLWKNISICEIGKFM